MSRDRRGDGVQVVAGSNPACPTKPTPSFLQHSRFFPPLQAYFVMHMIWLETERI
jgi:hypothetical protein